MLRISKKLVYGVGTKGNGIAVVNGKLTKAYTAWTSMLRRCHCPKALSRDPTYIGCSVCAEWLHFPTFEEWFNKNHIEGWHLDKDLLITGNKVYGPETSVFTPRSINVLFNDHGRARGDYPIGVTFYKRDGKFKAQLNIDGKLKHLGYFDSPYEAHLVYLIAKKANVLRMANEWRDKISDKLYDALIRKANDLI